VSRVFSSRVQNILMWTECRANPVVINMPGKFAKDLPVGGELLKSGLCLAKTQERF